MCVFLAAIFFINQKTLDLLNAKLLGGFFHMKVSKFVYIYSHSIDFNLTSTKFLWNYCTLVNLLEHDKCLETCHINRCVVSDENLKLLYAQNYICEKDINLTEKFLSEMVVANLVNPFSSDHPIVY